VSRLHSISPLTTKTEWRRAYRAARIIHASSPANEAALCKFRGVEYLAWFVVRYRRDPVCDPLNQPMAARLIGWQMVNEILHEETTNDRTN